MMYKDIRQSDEWAKYLSSIGWKTFGTSRGINVFITEGKFFRVAKLQRPSQLSAKDLSEAEEFCRRAGCLLLKVEPYTADQEIILKELKYEPSLEPLSPTTTSIIDLTESEEKRWSQLSSSGKYGVNRAGRQEINVEFHKNPGSEVLKDFFGLYAQSAKRKKFRKYRPEDLENKIKAFGDKSFIGLSRNQSGNAGAGGFYLAHNDTVWYMHGGTSGDPSVSKAGYMLFWEAPLYFKEAGYRCLDLEGISDTRFPHTKSWEGFSSFKKKFGGREVVFPGPYVKVFNPVLSLLGKIGRLKF